MIIEELESHFPSTECLQHGATSPWDNFECNYILSQMNEKATIIYYSYAYFWKHPMYYLALKYDAENGWHYLRLSDKKQTSSNIVHIYVRQWRYYLVLTMTPLPYPRLGKKEVEEYFTLSAPCKTCQADALPSPNLFTNVIITIIITLKFLYKRWSNTNDCQKFFLKA